MALFNINDATLSLLTTLYKAEEEDLEDLYKRLAPRLPLFVFPENVIRKGLPLPVDSKEDWRTQAAQEENERRDLIETYRLAKWCMKVYRCHQGLTPEQINGLQRMMKEYPYRIIVINPSVSEESIVPAKYITKAVEGVKYARLIARIVDALLEMIEQQAPLETCSKCGNLFFVGGQYPQQVFCSPRCADQDS